MNMNSWYSATRVTTSNVSTADRAIAVSNAVEELKEYATQVSAPIEKDSVVRFYQDDWTSKRHLL
jgi:hypothetical protein